MAILDMQQLRAFRKHCEGRAIRSEKEALKYQRLVLACQQIEDFMNSPTVSIEPRATKPGEV